MFVTIPLSKLYQKFGVKTAISLPDIVRQTNAFSKKYRPGCSPTLLDSNPKALFLHYNVKCNKEDSDPAGHDVRVQFDVTKVQESSQAKDLDVQISCSCVAPGTMVKMADGTEKPIEQIQVGDWVITHKGRARRVTAVTSRSAKENEQAWETKAEGYRDSLILSDDHPLGVVRGHELCACGCGEPLYPMHYRNVTIRQRWARRFVKGHYRRGEANPDNFSGGCFGWKPPFELVEREQLYFPKITWAGTEEVDPNFASLVGYYLAEGHVPVYLKKLGRWGNEIVCVKSAVVSLEGGEHRVYGVTFTLNQNERYTLAADIETKAKLFCGEGVEISVQDHQHKTHKWLTVTVKDKNLAAAMVRAVGRGSLDKKLSDWVLGWSLEAMTALVSSYALGDGYVGNGKQCVFSVSRDLISQVSMFLFSIGVWHGWTYHRKNGTKNTSYRLNWNYREYPQLLDVMMDRMREEDRTRAEARLNKESCWGDCRDREWGTGFIRSLRSKKRIKAPSVFHDLTVDEDESFIANGIVVHNCPAFLYWGAQWNLHQRDGLLGTPRPLLQAPTERLDLRGNFVICKHIHAVFERILPSVQHNVVKILREREIQRKKDEVDMTPERLQEKQEEMKKKKELEKIRKVKDKEVQNKLMEALQNQEEARMLHQKELEEQAEPVVERDRPATEPVEEAPKLGPKPKAPAPAPMPEPKGEEEAIQNLYQQEQKSIEEKHQKGEPHLHKGLPYEEEKPVKEKKSPEYMEKLRKVWQYIKDRAKELALSEEGK